MSPATVRNDMAVLEEEGYLRQPHTSAGRVPTDKGYRLFVDRLSRIKPLSPAERRAIERFLVGAVDLDDVVHRTVRLLAQLTRQVAVVQYPSLARSRVRHLELVPISTTRLHARADHRHRPGGAAPGRAARARSRPRLVNELRQIINDTPRRAAASSRRPRRSRICASRPGRSCAVR